MRKESVCVATKLTTQKGFLAQSKFHATSFWYRRVCKPCSFLQPFKIGLRSPTESPSLQSLKLLPSSSSSVPFDAPETFGRKDGEIAGLFSDAKFPSQIRLLRIPSGKPLFHMPISARPLSLSLCLLGMLSSYYKWASCCKRFSML